MSDKVEKQEIKKKASNGTADAIDSLNTSEKEVVRKADAKKEEVAKASPPAKKTKLIVSDKVKPLVKKKVGRPKKVEEDLPEQLITGEMLLLVSDIVLSRGISVAANQFIKDPKNKIDWHDLALEPGEKKQLEALANKAAETIGLDAPPLTTFAITLALMYGMKLL